MSIFGALNASVSGLQAQSDALGVISDNISNSNTVGFKERQATFESLVVNSGQSAGFSPGGVLSDAVSNVREQGQLRATNNNTDLAIQGKGFFAVKSETAIQQNADTPMKFTRNGQFRVNNEGLLVNTAGQVLQGWQIGPDGNLPVDQQNPDSLSSVDVNGLSGQARKTTEVKASVTLPSQTDPSQVVKTNVGNGDPGSSINDQFSDNLSGGNTAIGGGGTFTLNIKDDASTSNDIQFDIDTTSGNAPTLDQIAQAINNASNPSGISGFATNNGSASNITAEVNNGRLTISSKQGTVDVSSSSTNSDATLTQALGLEDSDNNNVRAPQEEFTTQVFDAQGNAHNLNVELSKTGNANEWQMRINAPRLSSKSDGAPSGLFQNSSGSTSAFAVGRVQFNSDGSLSGFSGFNEPGVTATGSGNLDLNIDFSSGTNATNANGQEITMDLGTPKGGGPNNNARGVDGLQQGDTAFTIDNIQQDGARFGNFTGVTVDEEGVVTAQFDNGEQEDIYKLPVAQFNSPNDLGRESGNLFKETQESGDVVLSEAGVGGAGDIQPSALERSTVDLSEQFSNMIETQQAYTANTRTLTTSDEMLQTLNQAVR